MPPDDSTRAALRLATEEPEGDEIERDLAAVRARGQGSRRRHIRAWTAVAAVVLVIAGLAAISQIGRHEDTAVTTVQESTWDQVLRPLPRIEGAGGFAVQDFAQAAANLGVAKPASTATDDERSAYWAQVTSGLPAGTWLPLKTLSAAQLRTELGFEPSQVRRMVTLDASGGSRPGLHRLAILEGDFDPQAIQAAVEADPVWSPQLETLTHGGVKYYSWGDGSITVDKRTPARPMGIGGRLIVLNRSTLAWTTSTFLAEAAIDAWTGHAERFVDDSRSRDFIGALESRNTDSASVGGRTDGRATLAFGVRSGSPGELVLALDEVSPSAAQRAASSLRASVEEGKAGDIPFRDQFAIAELQVTGRLVVARLTYTGELPLMDAISARRVPMFALEGSTSSTSTQP